jgi:hypothetical protein
MAADFDVEMEVVVKASKIQMFILLLVFALVLAGCATGVKDMYSGTIYDIAVPQAKNFETLGVVHYEGVVTAGYGEKITYDALLKEAEKIGGNGIVNILIDVKKEGKKFLGMIFKPKETWYGSALAVKYTNENLVNVTTEITPEATITKTSTPVAGSEAGTLSPSITVLQKPLDPSQNPILIQRSPLNSSKGAVSVGIGVEANMNTYEGVAFGGSLAVDYGITDAWAAGGKFAFSLDLIFYGAVVFDFEAFGRLYPFNLIPLAKVPDTWSSQLGGVFVQVGAGASWELVHNKWQFLGEAVIGWRFTSGKNNWYVEPAARLGVPFLWSVGVTGGYRFGANKRDRQ